MRTDNGPLLGQWAESNDPVALLQKGPRAYECLDPKAGERGQVTAKMADDVLGLRLHLLPAVPRADADGRPGRRASPRSGIGGDIKWLVFMALAIGLFGSVTPYFTGKIFDEAMPQADRETLVGASASR